MASIYLVLRFLVIFQFLLNILITNNINNYLKQQQDNQQMSTTPLISYTQIPLFVFGQCISQFLNYFVASDILYHLGTLAVLLSICLQLWAMITKRTQGSFIQTQMKCSINYLLTAITMYLNYQFIAVCPSEIFQKNLLTTIVGSLRMFFQTFAYSLLLMPKTPTKELFIYFATMIYWIGTNTNNTIELVKRDNSLVYEDEQKDIGICLLGLITSNGILLMDLYLRQWEKNKPKKKITPEIQMQVLA